jgi:uncharacterized protein (TIGR03000 family)
MRNWKAALLLSALAGGILLTSPGFADAQFRGGRGGGIGFSIGVGPSYGGYGYNRGGFGYGNPGYGYNRNFGPGYSGWNNYYQNQPGLYSVRPQYYSTPSYYSSPNYFVEPSYGQQSYYPPTYAQPSYAQQQSAPATYGTEHGGAEIVIRVPAHAEVWVNGVKSSMTGTERRFGTVPVSGQSDTYTVTARWTDQSGTQVQQTRTIQVTANGSFTADFLQGSAQAPQNQFHPNPVNPASGDQDRGNLNNPAPINQNPINQNPINQNPINPNPINPNPINPAPANPAPLNRERGNPAPGANPINPAPSNNNPTPAPSNLRDPD